MTKIGYSLLLISTYISFTSPRFGPLKPLDRLFGYLHPRYCIDYYTSWNPPLFNLKIPHSLLDFRQQKEKYTNCNVQLFHTSNLDLASEVLQYKLKQKHINVNCIVIFLYDGKRRFTERIAKLKILPKFNTIIAIKLKKRGLRIFQQEFFDLSGNVTLKEHIGPISERIFETRLNNLKGSDVLVSTWELPSFVVTKKENDRIKYYGPDQHTILVYAEKYNFTVKYVPPLNDGAKWGTYTNDSRIYSGQKGLVARGEVHLGSAGNWATDISEEYRDFVYPHLVDGVKFAVPPPTRKPYWYAFVLPFRYAAWIAIGLCIIFGGLVNWIIAKLCFLPINNKTNPWKDIWFSATYNFGALVARTMPTDHSPAPARLFNLSRILAYFFITAAFTSSIISYLSVPIPEDPIDSIKRVAESDLTISGIPDYYDLYINSVDPYMVQSLQRYNKTDENFDQFAYVNARLGACIDSERILSYYTQVIYKDRFNNPTIHIVKQDIAMAQNVALAPKNSIYTDAFSNISIRLFGSGLHQFWTKEAVLIAKKKYESFQPDLYEEKKFNLKSFQAPFIAWLFMLVVSITVFIFERCYPDYDLG